MTSQVSGATILQTLTLCGPATPEEILAAMQLNSKALDKRVLDRFFELLSILDKSGAVVCECGYTTGEVRYAVAMMHQLRLDDQTLKLLTEIKKLIKDCRPSSVFGR